MILSDEQFKVASEAAIQYNRYDVFPLLESHREQSKLIAEQLERIKELEARLEDHHQAHKNK
jgi:hypothetical protein